MNIEEIFDNPELWGVESGGIRRIKVTAPLLAFSYEVKIEDPEEIAETIFYGLWDGEDEELDHETECEKITEAINELTGAIQEMQDLAVEETCSTCDGSGARNSGLLCPECDE